MSEATITLNETVRNDEGKNERQPIASFTFNDPASFEDAAYGDRFENEAAEWRVGHTSFLGGLRAAAATFLKSDEGTPETLQAYMDGYQFPEKTSRGGGGGRRKSVTLDAEKMANLQKMAKKGGTSVDDLAALLGIDIGAAEVEA